MNRKLLEIHQGKEVFGNGKFSKFPTINTVISNKENELSDLMSVRVAAHGTDYIEQYNIETQNFITNFTHHKEDTKVLELQWLSYQDKRDKLDEYEDFLIEKFNHIKHWNAIINLLREILKNSADHTDWDVYVTVTTEKIWEQIKVAFSIYDDGPGIQENTTRGKKWPYNFGRGKRRIKDQSESFNIDLIIHNHWKTYHINNLWLQEHSEAKEKFGYEWIWMFDIQQ